MNIALFASAFHPHMGGVEEHVRQTAREYIRRGIHVVVITNLWPLDLPSHEKFEGIDVYRIAMRTPEGNMKARLKYQMTRLGIQGEMLRILTQHKIDLLHVHCVSNNGHWARLAHRRLGLPMIVSTHGERTMDATRLYERSPFTRMLLRDLVSEADHVTACSAHTLNDLETFVAEPLAERSTVVYNGIRLEEFEDVAPYSHGKPYILGIGRLVYQKGFDVLLRAFARGQMRDHDLLLAGDGAAKPALNELLNQLNHQGRAHLIGPADRTKAVSLFKGCSIFVLPSRQEPMGIVNLEAMAAGKAVIASNTGGVPEIVLDNETGVLVTPESPDDLAAAISSLLADPARAARLGAAGRRRVTQFTWSAAAAKYADIYQKSLAARTSGGVAEFATA